MENDYATILAKVPGAEKKKLSPQVEFDAINRVADFYKLNPDERKLLHAIRYAENGSQGREFGVLNTQAQRFQDDPDPLKSFTLQAMWAAGTIKKRYKGDVEEFGKRYAPTKNATNDPKGLNKNWVKNVKEYLSKIAELEQLDVEK